MGKYFHNTLADVDGISGDDLNRRHREKRLGYAAPSADWADCSKEIRCIHPYEVVRRQGLDNRELHVHADPAYWCPVDENGNDMIAPIRIVG